MLRLPPPLQPWGTMNTTELHTQGYTILRRLLDRETAAAAAAVAGRLRMEPIFNYNPTTSRNDGRRRQADFPDTVGLQALLESVSGSGSRQATDFVALESLPGCQAQAAHTDYVPDAALLDTTDDTVPLLAVIALQPATTLEVWPGSHHLIRRARLTRHTPKVTRRTVRLNVGDVIVFRGDLIHAGSPYTSRNLRLHAYIDHPSVPRPPNKTWAIQRHAEPMLRTAVVEGADLVEPAD